MSSENFENIIWDTTLDPINYPEPLKKKFFLLSLKNRNQLVKWIGELSTKFLNNFDWWTQIPATRDPYKSMLFKNIIILEILKDKKIKKNITPLLIESKNFKKFLINNKNFEFNNIKIKKKFFF